MKVSVIPAHNGLNRIVKIVKANVGGDNEPPPNRAMRIFQCNFQTIKTVHFEYFLLGDSPIGCQLVHICENLAPYG